MHEITVVITSWNLERYIESCLEELEAQSFRDFDVLIVDDRSTDETINRIHAFSARASFPFQLIVPPRHLGMPGKARNFALGSGLISGKYVVFLDGDDIIENDYLECLHELAESSGADISLCANDSFEEASGRVYSGEPVGPPAIIELPAKDDTLAFITGALWNKLILRDSIASLRLPDLKIGEDVCFSLALYAQCRKIVCTDRILIHYRLRSASVTSNTREEDIQLFAKELARMYRDSLPEWLHDTIGFVALIQIGVTMPFRANKTSDIDMRRLLCWIRNYFSEQFNWFRGNRFLTLRNRFHHGIALWGALLCHRLCCFSLYMQITNPL